MHYLFSFPLHTHTHTHQELRGQVQDRLELADYLIMPVSRLSKCSLLLSDFCKQSARSAEPAGQVEEALEVTRGISRQANNAIHLDMLEGHSKMEVGDLVLLVSHTRLHGAHRHTHTQTHTRQSKLMLADGIVCYCLSPIFSNNPHYS